MLLACGPINATRRAEEGEGEEDEDEEEEEEGEEEGVSFEENNCEDEAASATSA